MSVSAVRGLSRTELDVKVAVGRWQYGTGIQHPVLAAASQQRSTFIFVVGGTSSNVSQLQLRHLYSGE